MKYCDECNVNVHQTLSQCPLCGSYLEKAGQNYEAYERAVEPLVSYPHAVPHDSRIKFLRQHSLWMCLLAVSLCVLFNVLLTPSSLWSAYVGISVAVLFLCVLTSVYKQRQLYAVIGVCAFVLPLAALSYDLVHAVEIDDLSAFGTVFCYVIPFLYMAALLACDVFAIITRSRYTYYLINMWWINFVAPVPQILMWCLRLPAHYGFVDWFTLALFVFAIVNWLVMTILFWKKLVQELIRKFFV